MKVLLIWPKARTDPDWGGDLGAISEPLALEYLAAAVAARGHEPSIIDLRLHFDGLDAAIEGFVPDVVGVTAYTMHVSAALAICRRVKTLLPGCRTVVGGHHATFLPEDFFEPQIDYIVSGEGTLPFAELVDSLDLNRLDGIKTIPGIWYRDHGVFRLSAKNTAVGTDNLPIPNRSLTVGDRSSYFIDWMKPVASIRSTVGCPYRCTFCSLWQMTDGHYHMREIDPFVRELSTIKEQFVFLIDDEAFVNGKRMLRLAQAIKQAGLEKTYFAYCRIDTLVRQQDVLKEWRQIGLDRLLIGIDGISSKELTEYNKRCDLSQIEQGLELSRELDIEVFAQFIVRPDYTRRDFEQLARFVEHNKIRYPSFTVLTPLPGTPLLDSFDGIVERQANGRPNWDLFDTQTAVTQTYLPKDEFRRAYRDLFRQFRGSYSVHRGRTGAMRPQLAPSPPGSYVV